MEFMLYIVTGVFGLVVGSFVNAWVWRTRGKENGQRKKEKGKNNTQSNTNSRLLNPDSRLPISGSVLRGRSACPNCGHTLQASDLVPVLSWLWLRGKCRYCRNSISWQYPIVEITTAGLFIAVVWWWPIGLESMLSWTRLAVWLGVTAVIVALGVYDLRWYILPGVMLRALLVGAVLWLVLAVASGDTLQQWLVSPLLGATGAFAFFYALFVLGRGQWMGGGDVKLVFVLGLLAGGTATVVGLFIAFLSAAAVGTVLMLMRRKDRRDMVPFGPFLLGGFWLAFFFGSPIANWYIGLIAG